MRVTLFSNVYERAEELAAVRVERRELHHRMGFCRQKICWVRCWFVCRNLATGSPTFPKQLNFHFLLYRYFCLDHQGEIGVTVTQKCLSSLQHMWILLLTAACELLKWLQPENPPLMSVGRERNRCRSWLLAVPIYLAVGMDKDDCGEKMSQIFPRVQ